MPATASLPARWKPVVDRRIGPSNEKPPRRGATDDVPKAKPLGALKPLLIAAPPPPVVLG